LVLGEVELLFDVALAPAHLLVMFLFLEGYADFLFEFFRPLVGVGDVRFRLDDAFLEALDGRLQGTDCAQRGVGDAGGLTVLASAPHDLAGVVEARGSHQ